MIAIAAVICMSLGCEREPSGDGVGTVAQETPAVPTPTLTQETPTVPTVTPTPTPTPIPTPTYGPDASPYYACGPIFNSHGIRVPLDIDHFVDWTPDGSGLIFDDGTLVMMVNEDGSGRRIIVQAYPGSQLRHGSHADLSPDGTRIVYTSCEYSTDRGPRYSGRAKYHYEIASVAIDGSDPKRLTENDYMDHYPAWSPDGRRIAFISGLHYHHNFGPLRTMLADGSEQRELTIYQPLPPGSFRRPSRLNAYHAVPEWSPDGQQLAFVEEDSRRNLYTVRADGSELTKISETFSPPSWSPDGSRLAFTKLDGEDVVLYTVKPNGSDLRAITKITDREAYGGRYLIWITTLAWSPEGSHIMFSCGARICVVDLDGVAVGESPFEEYILSPLFSTRISHRHHSAAAWSPDGSRIAVRVHIDCWTNGKPVVYTMDPDGSNVRVQVKHVGAKLC